MAHINRRTFVKLAAATTATAAASRLALPAIAQSQPVRVGAALPFSGGLELFGQQARIGIDLAAAEINAQGGIMGRQIEILYEDMKTDPKTAAEKARKLVQRDEVIAVAGPITSSGRNAMVPHMMRLKTPLLYATNYEGADDEGGGCGRYLFFFNTVPNQDTAPLIPYLKREGIGTSYYMFGANYVWPRNMFKAAKAMIAETGGRTLAEEYTPFGVTDFTSVIRKVAASGADILLFALPGADGITFIKQAEEFGLMNNLTVAFLGFSETYLGAFGRGKGENMYVGVPFVASSDEPGVIDFVARVRRMHGPDTGVSHYVMTHYNALKALKTGLERAGTISREAAVDGMAGLNFTIPTGAASITPADHHIAMNMYIARTESGQLRVIERLGRIEPESDCQI